MHQTIQSDSRETRQWETQRLIDDNRDIKQK